MLDKRCLRDRHLCVLGPVVGVSRPCLLTQSFSHDFLTAGLITIKRNASEPKAISQQKKYELGTSVFLEDDQIKKSIRLHFEG